MPEIDLNAPAFGEGAQKISDIRPEEGNPSEEVATEPEVQEPQESTEPEGQPEGETQVPYSRFKKFHERAREAEAEAERWRQEAESLRSQSAYRPEPQNTGVPMPDYWRKLYGDSEQSQEAWQIQYAENERLKEEARQEALKAVQEAQEYETVRTEQNMEVIDDSFEDLEAYVGRNLTDKEQSAILDIVDEYTAKDDQGNYAGNLMPFEKAWEIYSLQQQATKAPKVQERNRVASLSGTQNEGTPSGNEGDAEFDPSWGALTSAIRKRFGS